MRFESVSSPQMMANSQDTEDCGFYTCQTSPVTSSSHTSTSASPFHHALKDGNILDHENFEEEHEIAECPCELDETHPTAVAGMSSAPILPSETHTDSAILNEDLHTAMKTVHSVPGNKNNNNSSNNNNKHILLPYHSLYKRQKSNSCGGSRTGGSRTSGNYCGDSVMRLASFQRRQFNMDTVACPPERRSFINYFVPLLRGNFAATRERVAGNLAWLQQTPPTSYWRSSSCSSAESSSTESSGGVAGRLNSRVVDLWRETLQWLHYSDDVVNEAFQNRDHMARSVLKDIVEFKFQGLHVDTSLTMSDSYMRSVCACMRDVEQLLHRLDNVEYLCISHKHLCSLYPEFGSETVQERIACLYMWRRALHLLNSSIYRLFQKLGAHRHHFATLLVDLHVQDNTKQQNIISLDLCADDMADFEDNILIRSWPEEIRNLVWNDNRPSQRPSYKVDHETDLRSIKARKRLYRKFVDENMHRVGLNSLRLDLKAVLDIAVPFVLQCLRMPDSGTRQYESTLNETLLRETMQQFRTIDNTTVGLLMSVESVQITSPPLSPHCPLSAGRECPLLSAFTEEPDRQKSLAFNFPFITTTTKILSLNNTNGHESPRPLSYPMKPVTIWSNAFRQMRLPLFLPHFLFLVDCPIDILYQCLRTRHECAEHYMSSDATKLRKSSSVNGLLPTDDSNSVDDAVDYSSLVQLFRECKEALCGAILAKRYFQQMTMEVLPVTPYTQTQNSAIQEVFRNIPAETQLSWRKPPKKFEVKLSEVMQDYFNYLWRILTRLQRIHDSSGFETLLENEWKFMKVISLSVPPEGEVEACRRFCRLVGFFVTGIEDFVGSSWNKLQEEIDEQYHAIEIEELETGNVFSSVDDQHDGPSIPVSPLVSDEEAGSKPFRPWSMSPETRGYGRQRSRESEASSSSPSEYRWSSTRRESSNIVSPSIYVSSISCTDSRNTKIRKMMMTAFRKVEAIFEEAKRRLQKALDNIRLLCKDMQVAASMSFTVGHNEALSHQQQVLFSVLHESRHVLVHCEEYAQPEHVPEDFHHDVTDTSMSHIMVFAPRSLSEKHERILKLLTTTFGSSTANGNGNGNGNEDVVFSKTFPEEELEYLLFVECHWSGNSGSARGPVNWPGPSIRVASTAEHSVKLSHAEVCGIMLMVADARRLERCCRYFLNLCPAGLIQVKDPHRACNRSVAITLDELKDSALQLGLALPETLQNVQEYVVGIYRSMDATAEASPEGEHCGPGGDMSSPSSMQRNRREIASSHSSGCEQRGNSRIGTNTTTTTTTGGSINNLAKVRIKFRDCMQRCYRIAFFYHRELFRTATEVEMRQTRLAPMVVQLLRNWIAFVTEWYPPSALVMSHALPSWAHVGCAFLLTVFQSNLVALMSEEDWNVLHDAVQRFMPHLLLPGESSTPSNGVGLKKIEEQPTALPSPSPSARQETGSNEEVGANTRSDISISSSESSTLGPMMSQQMSMKLTERMLCGRHEMGESMNDCDFRRAFSEHILQETPLSVTTPEATPSSLEPSNANRPEGVVMSAQNSTETLSNPKFPSELELRDPRAEDGASNHSATWPSSQANLKPTDETSQPFVEEETAAEMRQGMLERLHQLDVNRSAFLFQMQLIGRLHSVNDEDKESWSREEDTPSPASSRNSLTSTRNSSSSRGSRLDQLARGRGESNEMMPSSPLPYERHVNFKWQIGRKLGAGTFGDVYEAVRLDTHESIVVKCIKRKHLSPKMAPQKQQHTKIGDVGNAMFAQEDLEYFKETLREFDLFVSLRHPNLVRYHGIEASRQELLIFMERCPGPTLSSMVHLEVEKLMIRKYANKLLQAIAYLHERNIVHRDIKPDNVMLCEPSDPNILKLTDFGSATRIQQDFFSGPGGRAPDCVTSITQKLSSIGFVDGIEGTPTYMAPEVCKGDVYGTRCDIWSFGCVIWELFEGKRPHHEKTNSSQIIWKLAQLKPDAEALYRPKRASNDAWNFILSCIRVEPWRRPSAVDLLRTEFVKVVVSSAVVPATPSLWYHQPVSSPPSHRRRFHNEKENNNNMLLNGMSFNNNQRTVGSFRY